MTFCKQEFTPAIKVWSGGDEDPNVYAYLDSFMDLLGKEFLFRWGIEDIDSAALNFGISHDGVSRHLVQGDAFVWALKRLSCNSVSFYRLKSSLAAQGFFYEDGKIWTGYDLQVAQMSHKLFLALEEESFLSQSQKISALKCVLHGLENEGA